MDTSATPQDQTKVKNVIGKIQALRALSKSTHSRAEAESCLAVAEKLIAQFQLSEIELEVQGKSAEGIDLETESVIYESGKTTLWKSNLAVELASLNGLYIFSVRIWSNVLNKKVTRYRVIGRPSDIEVAVYQMEYLMPVIQGLADREYAAGRFVVNDEGKMISSRGVNPEKESYCLGCVRGFIAKMEAEHREVMKAASSAAMVLVSNKVKDAETAYIGSKGKGFKMGKATASKAQRDYSAMSKGYVKGQTITVSKGLT